MSLKILLTNISLRGRSGTEIVTRDTAMALSRRDHSCVVYCPDPGAIAEDLRIFGIPVVEDIRLLQRPFDIIHGHHLPTTATVMARFPETPAIFVCHDFAAWHDTPPQLPAIRRFVAVDETVADRLTTEAGLPPSMTSILLNTVDLERFRPGPSLPKTPRRALVLARQSVRHLNAIRAACEERGISIEVFGAAAGRVVDRPEDLMPEFDLIFASALTAMEAIACGRAVVVCDGRGLAGLVTLRRFETWRRLNFGVRTLRQPFYSEAIGREIDAYDPLECDRVCVALRREGGFDSYADRLIDLYRQVIDEHRRAPLERTSVGLAMAYHLQQWSPRLHRGWPWMRERQDLLDRIDTLEKVDALDFVVTASLPGHFRRFADEDREKWWQPLSGFSDREGWGVWTDGEFASLIFRTKLPSAKQLRCTIELMPYVGADVLHADVLTNGIPSAQWHFDKADSMRKVSRTLLIPPRSIPVSGEVFLAFRIKGAKSPESVGQANDRRQLGLGLVGLLLEEFEATA